MTGLVVISHTSYTPDMVWEGSIDMDRVVLREETFEAGAAEAARLIIAEGLSWTATGAHWAGSPDGTRTTDYATGEQTETCATLHDFHPRVEAAIMEAVDIKSNSGNWPDPDCSPIQDRADDGC